MTVQNPGSEQGGQDVPGRLPTVNDALVEYLEAAALDSYRRWDAEADSKERAALDALAAQYDRDWAAG